MVMVKPKTADQPLRKIEIESFTLIAQKPATIMSEARAGIGICSTKPGKIKIIASIHAPAKIPNILNGILPSITVFTRGRANATFFH